MNQDLDNMKNVDRCVCCGEILPEDAHVCINCKRVKHIELKEDKEYEDYQHKKKFYN